MCNMIHYLFMYLKILLCFTPSHSNKLDAFWTPNIDCTASSPDPCSLLVDICKPHGQCVPQGQCNYRCVCEGGFEGADCQTPSQSSVVDPGPEPSGTSNSKRLDIIVGNGALNFLDSLLKESTTSAKVLTTTDATTTTFTTMAHTTSTVNTLDSQVQESLPQSQALKSPEQNDTVVASSNDSSSLTKNIEETTIVTPIAVQKESLKAIESSMITTTTATKLPTTEIEQLSITSTTPPSLATADTKILPSVNQNLKEYTTVKPEETLMAEQALKPETKKTVSFEPQSVEEQKQFLEPSITALSNKETVETTTGTIVTFDNTTSAINDSSSTSPTSLVLQTTSKSTETGNEQVTSVRSEATQTTGPITSTYKPSSKSTEAETTKTTQTLRSTKIPVTTQQKLIDLTTTAVKIESPFVKVPPTLTTLNQESTLSLLSSLVSELKTLTENLPRTLGLRPVTQAVNYDQTSSKSMIETTVSTPSVLQSNSLALSPTTTISKEAPVTTTIQPTPTGDITTNKQNVAATLDTKSLINETSAGPSSANVEESTTLKPSGLLPLPLTHLPVLSALLDPNFRKFSDPKSPSHNTPPTPSESKVQESSNLGTEATEKSTSTASISTTNSKTTTEIPITTTNSFVSQDNVLISAAASKKSKLVDANHLTAAGDRPSISAKASALPGDSVYLAMSPSTTPNPTTNPIMTTTVDAQTQPIILIKNNEKNTDSTLPDVNDTPIHPWKSGQFVESHNTDTSNIVPNTIRGHMTRKGKITKDIPEDSLHTLPYAPEIHKVKSSTPSFIYTGNKKDVTKLPYFTTTTLDSNEESGDDTLSSSYTTPDSTTADSDDITTRKDSDYETPAAELAMSTSS